MIKWIVAYDIPHDGRRRKLANVLENFGDRVQYSVFEIIAGNDDFKVVAERINSIISVEEDSVRLYPSCESCASKVVVLGVGTEEPWEDPDVYIV